MTRYTITIRETGSASTILAPTAEVAATRARDSEASRRRFVAPGCRPGPCEVRAVNDSDPTDVAVSRFG